MWIAFVVVVHLFPVAALIGYPIIYVVAALITVAALAAFPIARARKLTGSAVVGAPVGLVLLAAALFFVIAAAVTGSGVFHPLLRGWFASSVGCHERVLRASS
ncbi:hypothetical protein JMF97_30865, partial [Micromonospora fiedleri]|nr:hypothetical protein [Micromonospora fiedleri]